MLREDVSDYFDLDQDSPYMLLVAPVSESRQIHSETDEAVKGLDKLQIARSTIPAVTHVDMSARIQTVDGIENPRFHRIIEKVGRITGDAVVINTSFNVRGEPIVCTPADAFRCFMRTGMDYLVIENFVLAKDEQTSRPNTGDESWLEEFPAD